jgi:hypothetical protein
MQCSKMVALPVEQAVAMLPAAPRDDEDEE